MTDEEKQYEGIKRGLELLNDISFIINNEKSSPVLFAISLAFFIVLKRINKNITKDNLWKIYQDAQRAYEGICEDVKKND